MKAYWVSVSFISFIVGGCCGHLCNAQEFDRRKQPPVTIENTSAVEDPEVRTTPQETPADVIIPVADLISTPPEVTFSTVVSNTVDKPRLPRALLLHGQGCAPCIRMERELGDLVGDNTAPIEIVKTWEKNQLESLGVTPSMMFHGTPLLIVLYKDGKIHSLTSAGFGCFLSGFHNRQEVINYLSLPEHGVDLTPRSPSSQVVATVAKAEGSAFDFAALARARLRALRCRLPDELRQQHRLAGGGHLVHAAVHQVERLLLSALAQWVPSLKGTHISELHNLNTS